MLSWLISSTTLIASFVSMGLFSEESLSNTATSSAYRWGHNRFKASASRRDPSLSIRILDRRNRDVTKDCSLFVALKLSAIFLSKGSNWCFIWSFLVEKIKKLSYLNTSDWLFIFCMLLVKRPPCESKAYSKSVQRSVFVVVYCYMMICHLRKDRLLI